MGTLFEFVAVGPWKFDPKRLVITHASHVSYEIDVEQMRTSAEVLDWIYQVAWKPWVKPIDVEPLLRLIWTILDPQRNLCSWGAEQGPIDSKAVALASVS